MRKTGVKKVRKRMLFALLAATLAASGAWALGTAPESPPEGDPERLPDITRPRRAEATPVFLDGGRVVTTTEVKAYVDARRGTFVDVRSSRSFKAGHVKGALHDPYIREYRRDPDFFPPPDSIELYSLRHFKDFPVIFYGQDLHDWRAYFAARIAIDNGFTYVMWMRRGYEHWTEMGFPAETGR